MNFNIIDLFLFLFLNLKVSLALRAFVEKDVYARDEFNNKIPRSKSSNRSKKAESSYYPHIYDGNISTNMNGFYLFLF